MSYLCYLCLIAHSGVQQILCCAFGLYFFIYVASFSGLSIFDCRYSLTCIYYLQPRCCQLELQVARVAADLV